jgi:two-component system cell cycle response regulator
VSDRDEDTKDKTVIITEKVDISERSGSYEPYLIQISGRETGQMYNLTGKTVRIGRDATCQIILDDPHISRMHAEIAHRGTNEILIRDLGSTNGIFVNGKRVTEQTLLDGDKILIGTRLYFKFCFQDAVDQNYQQNLFRAANIDSLTQLYNKKYFVDALSKEFSFSKRNNHPLSLLMIDIDHFKAVNDTHGHIAGDLVLKSVGQYLLKNLRLENIAARYGGEEFAIILRNVTSDMSLVIGERLRKSIENERIVYRGKILQITVSIGVSSLDDGKFETIEDLIRSADENLYEAKETGRNKVILKRAA